MNQNTSNVRARVLAELRTIRQRVVALEQLLEPQPRPPAASYRRGAGAVTRRRKTPERSLVPSIEHSSVTAPFPDPCRACRPYCGPTCPCTCHHAAAVRS